MIKAVQGDPDDDEGCYYAFCEAEYFEIPNLLEDESFRTFKQAVDEDLPLGGFWIPLTKNGTTPPWLANESESVCITRRSAACKRKRRFFFYIMISARLSPVFSFLTTICLSIFSFSSAT